MRTRTGCRRIKLAFHRSFRRSVKIRVEAEFPNSADWITTIPPARVFLLKTPRPASLPRPALRILKLEPFDDPDWRIVGDHEGMLGEISEDASV